MFSRRAGKAVAVAANHDCAQDIVDAIEHLETVRRGWRAFNHRDFAGAVRYFHPDGEVFLVRDRRDPEGGVNAGPLRGRDEVRRFLEELSNAWQRVTVELREVLVSPDGRLLAVEGWQIERPEIAVATKTITVYTFRDGLVARLEGFVHKAKALEGSAAGSRRRRNGMKPRHNHPIGVMNGATRRVTLTSMGPVPSLTAHLQPVE